MTNTQINKAIRKIIGNENVQTYTDPRSYGHRSKFIFARNLSAFEAHQKLIEVQAFIKKNKIKRIASLFTATNGYAWEMSGHTRGKYITLVTRTF